VNAFSLKTRQLRENEKARKAIRDSLHCAAMSEAMHAIHDSSQLICSGLQLQDHGSEQVMICVVIPRHALTGSGHYDGVKEDNIE